MFPMTVVNLGSLLIYHMMAMMAMFLLKRNRSQGVTLQISRLPWLQNTYQTWLKHTPSKCSSSNAVSSNSIYLKGNAWRSESAFSSALQQMKLARHLPCPCCVGVSQRLFWQMLSFGVKQSCSIKRKGYQTCWIHLNPKPEAIYLRNHYL